MQITAEGVPFSIFQPVYGNSEKRCTLDKSITHFDYIMQYYFKMRVYVFSDDGLDDFLVVHRFRDYDDEKSLPGTIRAVLFIHRCFFFNQRIT